MTATLLRATHRHAMLALALLAVAACSRSEAWPVLTGEPRREAPAQTSQMAPQTDNVTMAPLPGSSAGAFGSGQSSGTYVGQKVDQLRTDLVRLQSSVADHQAQLRQVRDDALQNGQRYYGNMAAINARLQIGTTPGNPNLVAQWNEAQANLDRIGDDVTRLNNLANLVAGDSALAAYILESTRAAFTITGAVDEDHRALVVLEDDTNRTTVLVDRLLNDISDDVSRQTAYVNNERRNLTTQSVAIKNGELYGAALAARSFGATGVVGAPGAAQASLPMSSLARGRPLVVIKFDRANVAFQQPLYTAVSQALDRAPNASFEIVAVSPNRGNVGQAALASGAARGNAESVYRAMTDMGLPPARVSLSATSSAGADANEVHVFVR
jgi:hypothetical protein